MDTPVFKHTLVERFADLHDIERCFADADTVVFDTETTGLRPYHGDKVCGFSLYFPEANRAFYIPVRHGEGNNLNPEQVFAWLKGYMFDPSVNYIGFNTKFDLHFLLGEGLPAPTQVEDVMIAAHLLNENEALSNDNKRTGAYQLKRLARKYLGAWAGTGEDELKAWLIKKGYGKKGQMWQLPAEDVAYYAMMDVVITWHLREFYRPHLERWHQWELYKQRNDFLLYYLLPCERNGVYTDIGTMLDHMAEIQPKTAALLAELREAATECGLNDFNPNAPAQVKAFLNMKGYHLGSTNAKFLEPLARDGELWPSRILDYRRLSKARTSFYIPYLEHRDKRGYIHTSYFATGTSSGRISSGTPNFQQISKRGDLKKIFKPRPGYIFMQFDYKTLELRLAVHFAKEGKMRQMMLDGADLHQYTADRLSEMLNRPISRQLGKTSNFGLVYGQGARRAALEFGIDLKLAEQLVRGWRSLYPAFQKFSYALSDLAQQWRTVEGKKPTNEEQGYQYLRLFNGRVRHYSEFAFYGEDAGFKDALNFLCQGTGAAVTEISALRIGRQIDGDDRILPIMTTHDSLTFEVHEDYINEAYQLIKIEMEDWDHLFSLPLLVSCEIGRENLKDMVEYDPEA